MVRPGNDRIPSHLCSSDVKKIVNEVEPELAIIQHFGMKMIRKTQKEARDIQEATGIKTLAARYGMELDLSRI